MKLYLSKNTSICAGSAKIQNFLNLPDSNVVMDKVNLEIFYIEDILSEGIEIPAWLDGTPICLLQTNNSNISILKGSKCVMILYEMLNKYKSKKTTPQHHLKKDMVVNMEHVKQQQHILNTVNEENLPTVNGDDEKIEERDFDKDFEIQKSETPSQNNGKVTSDIVQKALEERKKTLSAQ